MKRCAQGGEDKGKLANLCERERALHGSLQRLPGKQESARAEHRMPHHDGSDDAEDGHNITNNERHIDHHTHGDEEDGTEEVFHWVDEMLNLFGLNRFCQYATHDEGTKGCREANGRGDDHHTETKGERHDEHGLIGHQRPHLAQEQGDEIDAHNEPKHKEEHQLENAHQHLRALELLADGQRGEHHHERNGKDVFDDEHAEHETSKTFLPQSHVVERLEDDSGGRHSEHSAEIDAVHLAPPEGIARKCSHQHHAHDDCKSRDERSSSHAQYLAERELQAEGEEQENDTYLTPKVHAMQVGDTGHVGHIGRGKETCHDVA